MDNYNDEVLASRLRALIDARRLSIREVSEAIDVPYRTLQNQLLGKNKMPASTFAKLLSYLELPVEFLVSGRISPRLRPLQNALKRTLGDLLPAVDSEMALEPAPTSPRSAEELDHHARAIAFIFRERYEWEVAVVSDLKIAMDWEELKRSSNAGPQSDD